LTTTYTIKLALFRAAYNLDLQLPLQRRTPRTFDEEHSHQCAMQGRYSFSLAINRAREWVSQTREGELTQ